MHLRCHWSHIYYMSCSTQFAYSSRVILDFRICTIIQWRGRDSPGGITTWNMSRSPRIFCEVVICVIQVDEMTYEFTSLWCAYDESSRTAPKCGAIICCRGSCTADSWAACDCAKRDARMEASANSMERF